MSNEAQTSQSAGNLAIVRQLYARFTKHDIGAILPLLSPNVEWGEPSNPFNPSGGTRYGHAGFLEWARIGREAEDILALEPKWFLTDSENVAVVGYARILAKPTNKIYETDFVHLFTLSGGTIVRFQEFFDTYIAGEAFRHS